MKKLIKELNNWANEEMKQTNYFEIKEENEKVKITYHNKTLKRKNYVILKQHKTKLIYQEDNNKLQGFENIGFTKEESYILFEELIFKEENLIEELIKWLRKDNNNQKKYLTF